jgi:NAD+ synthase (glutamine-hydrolysing)
MKIAVAQLDYTIGDFEGNKLKIIEAVTRAKTLGADLAIFAQGAISGTPCYDLLRKYTFLEYSEEALVEIASYCDDISVLVGLPIQGEGGTVCAAAHIHNRRIEHFITKKLVPSREEKPYLVAGKGVKYLRIAGEKVAVVVGEDITAADEFSPNIDLVISITSHPYCRGIVERRYNYFSRTAYKSGHPVVYVNQVGGQTDILFDGSSAAFNAKGKAIALLKSFEEDFQIVDTGAKTPTISVPAQDKTANVFHAMKMGLADYFRKNGFEKACLGMSGGIDSAVVAAMAVEALGAANVRLLMMPSQFSTGHSVDDAVDMAGRLGVAYDVLPITEAYKAITETMLPVLGGTRFDTTEENIQARIRGVMLMALSNKWGHIVLNCSNKSESAVGYGTLYGDSIGAISIAGDLYKSEIYDLARYINKMRPGPGGGGVIPANILQKEPSAELSPGQLDSDRLPSYEVLDAILYRMIEKGQHREEIINAGFDATTVMRVHKMLLGNEYKRRQGCPVFRLSTAPLGKEFVMPLTNKYGGYGL